MPILFGCQICGKIFGDDGIPMPEHQIQATALMFPKLPVLVVECEECVERVEGVRREAERTEMMRRTCHHN
jgi:hypothetical protein